MVRAMKIPARGPVEIVMLPAEEDGQLQALQGHVGGYIEAIEFGTAVFWCNEDGKRLRLPLNIRATDILLPRLTGLGGVVDEIVGDVIVTGPANDEGSITDLVTEP